MANSTNSVRSVSYLSNDRNKPQNREELIKALARKDIFETLKIENLPKKSTYIEGKITKIKDFEEGKGENKKLSKFENWDELKATKPYNDIIKQYEGKEEKEKMYLEIAERMILNEGRSIIFKNGDTIGTDKVDENFVRNEYEKLNSEEAYQGNLDFFTVSDKEGNLYIIKWTKKEQNEIKNKVQEKESELQGLSEDELKKKLFDNDNKEENTEENSEENTEENTEENSEENAEENTEENAEENTEENAEENSEEDTEENNSKSSQSQTKKDNKSNKKSEKKDKKKKDDKQKGKQENSENKEQNEKEEFLRRLKEYCPWLFENVAKDTNDTKNTNDTPNTKEENKESIEENPLFVSRKNVEKAVATSRKNSDFPAGTIEIKGVSVKLEEFAFYEDMKKEYIEAKGDSAKLQKLDKEFAEMLILSSPKGASVDKRFQIKLTKEEIMAGGLVVSQDRLSKYGMAIDYYEFTNTIIEREYQERIETVKKIETEIHTLTTIITELTTKIDKNPSNKELLSEIKEKKERIKKLKEKLSELLSSLKNGGNDAELLTLKNKEKDLTEELKKLEKQNLKEEKEKIINKIKEALNGISEEKQLVRIITKEGKECQLQGNGQSFSLYFNEAGLLDGESGINHKNLLKMLENDTGDIKEIIIGQENMPKKPQRFILPENTKDLEERKAKIEEELAKIKEQIKQKEANNKKRISLGEFHIGENGHLFRDYCKRNGIKRKDKKPFDKNKLEDDYMDVEYVDKNGRTLKLKYIDGAEDDGHDNPQTRAEFVYYEESGSSETSDIESRLSDLIKEQDKLLQYLEDLQKLLEKNGSNKQIEKKIIIIKERLTIISQQITEITNTTRTYKETITQERYAIVKVKEIPIPDWNDVIKEEKFEMTAALSDMGTDVFREKAALKVEEDLKAYYKSLGRWQVGSRLALFLGRGSRRKRMIKNEMSSMANTAFQTGSGYSALNEQSQNAADRHKHEFDTSMEAINRITTIHNDEIDQLCRRYLNSAINDSDFQDEFNRIIATGIDDRSGTNIQSILNGEKITHIGTNVLLRLKEQKTLNQLITDMNVWLANYNSTNNSNYITNMRNAVSKYIKGYQKTPAFMQKFENFAKNGIDINKDLEKYLSHETSVMQMQITNLKMNIDILNKGKSAYQIDNKDREKGKGGRMYKVGHLMDKHPRGTTITSTALSLGIGMGTGLIASPVLAGAVSLGLFGGLVGTTNAIKKWTHHTKEQNTHEKNMVTDYRNEQAKIQARQNQALNGRGRKKYKAKRQLALYDQTTQENIKLSDQITQSITNLSAKVGPLTSNEEDFMRGNLIEGWARLKYYREMGHNFLASEDVDKTEKDMNRLEKAITLGLEKLGTSTGRTLTTNDIETGMTTKNGNTYNIIKTELKESYDKSLVQFKRERRNLALKYGIGTALASIGIGAAIQWATGSGIFAKEVPGTPPTAPTGGETTSYAGGSDNFTLGGDNLSNGSVYNTTKSAITGSGAPTGSELTFNYGVGTDGTRVISSFNPTGKFTALNADFANTSLYPNLSSGQVSSLQTELSKIMTDPSFVSAFKDSDLARMRAMESLEHFARALNDSGRSDLLLSFNHTGSIPGMTNHNLAERFMTGAIDITTPTVPGLPGDPGIPAKTYGRWIMGGPLFFNTFKDRKSKKDTTDQKRGREHDNNQHKQPHQNPQNKANQPKHS